ncbi:EscU/YscU/HrcU family type III secretion system export apparatus switch protein [Thiobacillus sedimenti]|uniref:EscU/YscU/HrcU family type III secretion system export apparatus switch protein n=1 Tax=Thiobacillus sedimenti TaxID=3110231 RepID=A0ABZ1CFC5_9PROT|nr:EscU/YscU/HrcU family type III secretion system export apparatus switch protein [Thiobacillus sp. SCUT-2]WRS37864.1 EscU/YscU/HrcU family type III secretion system export apparatus switch protein [Thiobacillus sp. SCUT-2]
MAEETDLSRTEPASARRLHEARSAGDVPRSGELTAWLVLLAALAGLSWGAPRLLAALQALTEAAFLHAAQPLSPAFLDAAWATLFALAPVLAAIGVSALVAPVLLSGWVFAPHATRADFTRIEPLRAVARLFSPESLFDGTLTLLKLALAAGAVGWALASGWPGVQSLAGSEPGVALERTAAWIGRGVLVLAAALALAAALDAGWRWWRYLRRHAMTWQEVLAEAREAEVNPEVRAQMRGRQQEAGQGANARPNAGPLPNPLPQAGEGANARPNASPLPNPLPLAGAGANARPNAIDEVIG